ncbi:MAG TPA: 4-hydroxy-tetrahydrodipicolinate reductase [Bacteroidales bacterium]|nr:4-hydroxy-tetrahydrodipicolinate reductase [Bacteroidales bacterium]
MKIALLGYGKMGHEIEKIALDRQHRIELRIDIDNQHELTTTNLQKADVAIDFSTPASAFANILKCFEAGVPVVCGTTGWLDKVGEVKQECQKKNGTFFYASNYSLGVNIFFAVNRYLSSFMNNIDGYNVNIKEIHHIHKLDAPSGTAISLANDLIGNYSKKKKWELNKESDYSTLNITAVREGEVPGTHIITWDSSVDRIEIMHQAKSRKGFALGAVLAAEFIREKKGAYSMSDLIRL